jgi:predicted AAA+ superfamily ATPase
MDLKQNPFNELYVSETVKPEQFVHLFSPILIKHVEEIFLPGNVVLQGVQGSGKTMLLNLLKPEVRIAYLKNRLEFPVADHAKRFVGAGINLNTSRATDFGQRIMSTKGMKELDLLPLYFGDFLNFWIVYDLLRSIQTLCQHPPLAEEIGLSKNVERMNDFAKRIARDV